MAGVYMAKVSEGRGQLFQVTLAPKTARVLTGVSQSRGDLNLMKALYPNGKPTQSKCAQSRKLSSKSRRQTVVQERPIKGQQRTISGQYHVPGTRKIQKCQKHMSSCSTRKHVFLLNKKTCLLVEQENMCSC